MQKKFFFFMFALSMVFLTRIESFGAQPGYRYLNIDKSDKAESESLAMYAKIGKPVPIRGNTAQLKYFLNSVKNAKTSKVRVGHFGDSLIWGDVITADIRDLLQTKFGGKGIGMMAACNDDLMIRQTLTHRFSDDWEWTSVFTKNSQRYPLSINGIVSVPAKNSWVSYDADRSYESARNFKEIRIFSSNTNNNSKVNITSRDGQNSVQLVNSSKTFNETNYVLSQPENAVKLEFNNCEGAFIYGISLENGNGVYVDNFAMRGNSGASLKNIDEAVLKGMIRDLNYKLFILNFGINVVEAGKTNYTWYEKKMVNIIKDLQKEFPETSFVIVSAGDKAIKKGSRLVSDPVVPTVVEVQEKIANEAGVAFWSLYETMGGEGSMTNWVKEGFANKDYIHFNSNGGKIIAEYLVNALLNEDKN